MKPILLTLQFALLSALLITFFTSCEKEIPLQEKRATLTINISNPAPTPPTKLNGSALNDEEFSNTIRSLDIFVFNYNTLKVEYYQRVGNAWTSTGVDINSIITQRNFDIDLTCGPKKVLVIANSILTKNEIKQYYKSGINSSVLPLHYQIYKEFPSVFTMFWVNNEPLNITSDTNLTVELSKLVSRIVIRNITAPEAGTYNVEIINYLRYANIGLSGSIPNTGSLEFTPRQEYYGDALDRVTTLGNRNNNQTQGRFTLEANQTKNVSVHLYLYPRPEVSSLDPNMLRLRILGNSKHHYITFGEVVSNVSYEFDNITLKSTNSSINIANLTPTSTKSTSTWESHCYSNVEF